MPEHFPPPWEHLDTEEGQDLILFQSQFSRYRNPRNDQVVRAVILQAPDWVNVVALTPEEEVVTVKQFRFGTGEITTEIPAGLVEPGETPLKTAQRELREETGYISHDWQSLGYVEPNPAYLNNRCHLFLAREAAQVGEPEPEPGEDLRVETLTLQALQSEIAAGRLRHALALAGLNRVFTLWKI
jgi:8-oxo-dGTP pyrophosphatase MutT (NUDIX family)